MRSEVQVVITNPTGLHARPAVKLARLAAGFDAHIEIRAGDDGEWIRARSTARVMKLKAGAQSTIHIRAEGSQADDALSALIDFVRRDFDEGPTAASPETIERSMDVAGDGSESAAATGDVAGGRLEPEAGGSLGTRTVAPEAEAAASRERTSSATARALEAHTDPTAAGRPGAHTAAPEAAASRERTSSATARALEAHIAPTAAGRPGAHTVAPEADAEVSRERTSPATARALEARTDPTTVGVREDRTRAASETAPAQSTTPAAAGARSEERTAVATGEAPEERTTEPARQAPEGRTVSAVAASPGLAIGVLHRPRERWDAVRNTGCPGAERNAFGQAVARALAELNGLAERAGELARDVIGFQISLLQDPEFLGPVQAEIDAGAASDQAWTDHLTGEIADYEAAPTAYLRERAADLRDLRERVASAFADDAHRDGLPEQCIVIADELTPSRFLEIDWSRALGVATYSGSPAGHAAMLARAHGVPMLVRLACAPGDLANGAEAILDADRGCLVLAPPPPVRERYVRRIEERRAREREVMQQVSRPARTREGTPARVLLNVDDPAGLVGIDPSYCDGIGLTRTEFLFHGAAGLPDEETQLRCYRQLVAWARGRPVTVRTLDAGGDKPISGLTLEGERNPFLGLRGVRLSLSRPEVFATQLRALARAAAGGELKVMLPMVTKPVELDEARRLLASEVHALRSAGVAAAMPRLGMMVEVPAAALTIETFDADFFSIGTNDLTQYVLAAGRDSTTVADLLDPLHPAVLELIARVAGACARAGREVSVCGEMAARPEGLRALLDAGIRMFSVPPAALASTKAALSAL